MTQHLVFIGDSLTEWFDWQRRFPDYKTTNLGVSGERVQELLRRRERIRTAIENPAYIFLMTGINNIANEQYDIFDSYREIVRNFTTWFKRTNVVIQSILPVDLPWTSLEVIKDANRELEQIARDFNAPYLDIFSSFLDRNGRVRNECLQDDGVHLNGEGYRVWSDEVEKFLRNRQERR